MGRDIFLADFRALIHTRHSLLKNMVKFAKIFLHGNSHSTAPTKASLLAKVANERYWEPLIEEEVQFKVLKHLLGAGTQKGPKINGYLFNNACNSLTYLGPFKQIPCLICATTFTLKKRGGGVCGEPVLTPP